MRKVLLSTPEQVQFRLEVAGLATRALAYILDQLLLMVLRWGIGFALNVSGNGPEEAPMQMALILILFFVLDFGFFTFCEWRWSGQTPGKRWLGLRVVNGQGGHLRPGEVLLRNLLRPVDFLPAAMMVGGLFSLIDSRGRRLGDLVAGTLVIRERKVELPALTLAQQRSNTFQDSPVLKRRILSRVSREERDLLLDLLMRRDGLNPDVREELFGRAAAHFRKRFELPKDQEFLSDEQTVLNLALVIQGGGRGGG